MNMQEETTGMSALMATIQKSHKSVAQFLIAIQLIRDSCNVNLVDKSGKTALIHAVELGTCYELHIPPITNKQVVFYCPTIFF